MAEPKPSQPSEGAMRVDTDLIRELAELLSANELNEIQVEDGDRKIKVVRHQQFPEGLGFVGNDSRAGSMPAAPAHAPAHEAAAEAPAGNAVKSPMVGTAFLSPEPGAKPFVSVGDAVKAGDTLLILEAMKVMNPITAPSGGVIKQIIVSDGQPVEFDQPLVIIG
jgi:acetyl-CoA carboxylase biotin carboxyl carrier protein